MISCAACRVQRKKCSKECVLAPHFPPNDPEKFAIVHRIFGTGQIIKLLQGMEGEQRADAVNSMVYEASARVKDPVHGCAKEFDGLQKQIDELESQLAATQAELKNLRSHYDKLVSFLGIEPPDSHLVEYATVSTSQPAEDIMYEEVDSFLPWASLWDT
ncbi:hypothetical protein SUGI_0307490 [Cryptomeria japonica]|nr:hypothetical protein SUGI_0307490 [Cryptomeria japonica]